jgi:protein arginine kinase activator
MLCQDCGKKEATVQVTLQSKNQKVTLNLCQECADKRQFRNPLEGVPFQLAEFLASMLSQAQTKKPSKEAEATCSECGMGFSDFAKSGRLGCGNCYLTFRSQLNDLLRKVHGNTQHRGKFPRTTEDVMKPLWEENKLQEELKKAIEQEDFERAAQLRDQIRTLAARK